MGKNTGCFIARKFPPCLNFHDNRQFQYGKNSTCKPDFHLMGVFAQEADITCNNLQVVGCGRSGVCASTNATITLSGQGTNIQGNNTNGYHDYYGLDTCSSSSIYIVHPLTKEEISTNNSGGNGGGNWGGSGTIEQISK